MLDVYSKHVVVDLYLSSKGSYIASFFSFGSLDLSFVYTENKGMAFGLFPQVPCFLSGVRIMFAVGLLCLAGLRKISSVGAVLVAAGALGNALDVFFYGHVVDWIAFSWGSFGLPVFNIADGAIVLGVLFLLFP